MPEYCRIQESDSCLPLGCVIDGIGWSQQPLVPAACVANSAVSRCSVLCESQRPILLVEIPSNSMPNQGPTAPNPDVMSVLTFCRDLKHHNAILVDAEATLRKLCLEAELSADQEGAFPGLEEKGSSSLFVSIHRGVVPTTNSTSANSLWMLNLAPSSWIFSRNTPNPLNLCSNKAGTTSFELLISFVPRLLG